MQTEATRIGAHPQIDRPRGLIEPEVQHRATSLVSNRRRHTKHKPTLSLINTKHTMLEMRIERPHIDRQLRMLSRQKRNNIEHEHGLAQRIIDQVELQTSTITVRPHPHRIRQRPAPTQKPIATQPLTEHHRLPQLDRMIQLTKRQRTHMQTQRSLVARPADRER